MTHRQKLQHSDSVIFFRLNPISACVKAAIAGSVLMAFATPAAAELPVPSAVWASMGGATRQVIGNNMTIKQETDRVILNWDKFNVSADSSVNFKQPSASSIALNKIGGNDPSRILGTVTANGQIYLVNKNGFVFGKDSVVNVHGLVASTLAVSEQTFKDGITKVANIDQRAAFEGSGEFYQKNDDGSFKLDANGKKIPISIKIENGAKIKSDEGGRILVMAPTIVNSGSVESSGGQVVMAAATDKVYLQEAPKDSTKDNSDVRGLLVEVKTGGKVENLGNISANRGNVTLMGFAVNQKGKVSATTSTNVNGTIRLLAREGGSAIKVGKDTVLTPASTTRAGDSGDGLGASANVTLASGSKTEILPEVRFIEETKTLDSGEKVKVMSEVMAGDTEAQPQSRVEIMAHKVHMQSGSEITAPSGKVDVTATKTPSNPVATNSNKNDSRILIDSGAKIDVSGIDTVVKTMESNILEVELRNFELKDAPLQKTGILKGKTVLVDIREGTPLTDIQPTVKGIKRTITERLSRGKIVSVDEDGKEIVLKKGAEINLKSEGDVIVEKNATLDFSGGAIAYRDGFITTSKLLANGRIIDISEANPLQTYDGLYGEVVKSYKKWGVTRVWKIDGPFSLSRFEKGYVEGQDAGSLLVKGNTVVLDGNLLGQAINGRRQRDASDQAKGGRLEIDNGFSFDNIQSVVFSQSTQNTVDLDKVVSDELSRGVKVAKIDAPLPTGNDGLAVTLALQANKLFESGASDVTFKSNGKVSIADDATLKLVDGGKLKLKGGEIDVRGNIEGAGATVELETAVSSSAGLDGDITVADGASIKLQGEWVNDFTHPENQDGKSLAIKGGVFSAKAGGRAGGGLNLKAGSLIDVSGGAWLKSDRKLVAGEAGSITLVAEPGEDNVGANLALDGVLNAYGIEHGGSLTLKANSVAIRREEEQTNRQGLKPLQIATSFFGNGGFAEFDIGSNLNGLTVEDGAIINLSQNNRILNGSYLTQDNASGIAGFSTVASLLPEQRQASKLTLRADHSAGVNADSRLTVASNAAINADDLSAITLESDSSLVFNGEIKAHGGTVALNIIRDQSGVDPQYQETQGIWLGNTAKIDVSGSSQITVDGLGRRSGEVFDGGKVAVKANRGFFVSQAGSLIDVSGSQAVVDLPANNPNALGVEYQSTLLGSHAGTVDITSAEGAFIDGRMLAKAGGAPGTAGGTLSVFIDIDKRDDPDVENSSYPGDPRTIVVSQNKNVPFSQQFAEAGDSLPDHLNGKAYLAASQVADGGFSSLALAVSGGKGEIRFQGDIDLELKNAIALDAVKFGWERQSAADTGKVRLAATTATLGSDTVRTPSLAPVDGAGHLIVNADLIDLVGGSVTSGFNAVDLVADGDIRLKGIRIDTRELDFVGEFKTYSKFNLTADQVYPTSLTEFTLGVSGDPSGTVTFNRGDSAPSPVLSALGKVTVKAPNIVQNGVLSAPLGEIALEAAKSVKFGAHSVTSVSAAGSIVPLGVTQGGQKWLLSLAGIGSNLNVVNPDVAKSNVDKNQISDKKRIFDSPEKKITVTADRIQRDDGALVDLSGGGDMLAYEFIPGDGGSLDVLDSDKRFAVVPGIADYSPFDPKTFPNSGLKTGDSIFIADGSGLAAGQYALLPARYALLPGAFLVTPMSGGGNVVSGSARTRVDGAAIVSGYRTVAGTDIRDQRWSEFVIEDGGVAKTRSEYNISYASQFFADQALREEEAIPRLPQDAGQLVLNAKFQLDLPTVRADVANGGRGGLVDIVSDNLAVVDRKTGAAGVVELLSSDIDKFKVDSLALGAIRSFSAGNVKLDVKSKTVTIEDTTVKAPELLLAATETVELKAGARVEAEGDVADDASTVLEVTGDGALLRASAGKQATVKRTGNNGTKGDLLIDDGAVISAGKGAVLLDSTHQASMSGKLLLDGGSLSIGAETINLGETDGVVDGMSLGNRILGQLSVSELVLTSRGMVNIYGQLSATDASGNAFNFGNLMINAHGLAGKVNAGKTVSLNAKTLTFANSNTSGSATSGDGTGSLNINAEQLNLAEGNYQLSGFDRVNVNLNKGMVGSGETTLAALGDLTINTPFVSAKTGAKTTIDATGHAVVLGQASQATTAGSQGIGAQLLLEADSIAVNTALLYKTGTVSLNALQGDVTLGGNALIDVSGALANAGLSKPLSLSAGNISLSSQKQQVVAEAGSKLLLNGINAEMIAGMLSAQAVKGQVNFNGMIDAHGVGKANGGRIAIDTGSLNANGFDGLNSVFADAGFTGSVDLRLRNGDIAVDAGQTVKANAIKLVADSGKIGIGGTLDATGDNGGSVKLAAEDGLSLDSSARILAGAKGQNGNGGKVAMSAIDQHGDGAGMEIKAGARIDVAATGSGNEGEVRLRADRKDTDGDGVADIDINTIAANTVSGDADVAVEAAKIYDYNSIGLAEQAVIHADNKNYMGGLTANNVAGTRFGNGFTVIADVEVSSEDDLTIAADAWDMSSWRYGAGNLPGKLTLRAKGNLAIDQDLSDAFVEGQLDSVIGSFTVTDFLQSGQSWSYQLVAGADTASADNLAVNAPESLVKAADTGDVTIGNDVKVRTGTGDIVIRAGRNIVYGNENSVIYTAGRPDDVNRYGSGGPELAAFFYAEYPLDGGDISLQAGKDIKGQPTAQLLSEWVVRTGNWSSNENHSGERPTAWGIALGISDSNGKAPQHQQSVAAFGGGNVTISAGGSINDLSVAIPTNGKQTGQKTLADDPGNLDFNTNRNDQINGGGNLNLNAGGDIAGGVFYVDGGTADLRAAGSFKAGNNKVENKGLNPILALGDAQFNVVAGKDITLEAIVDPMFVTTPDSVDAEGGPNRFFRYSADSAVKLTALAGDITLENNPKRLNAGTNTDLLESRPLVYAAALQAYALNGDIAINGNFTLFPSRQGGLELFAANNISGNATVYLSDAEPAALPSAALPLNEKSAEMERILNILDSTQSTDSTHATVPLHADDVNPVLISTGSGNIGSRDESINLGFVLAKPAEIKAGKDIVKILLEMQHNTADAASIVSAGRDISFPVTFNTENGEINKLERGIEVLGPGQLTVFAGRDVNLGASNGIISTGDQSNPALLNPNVADDGADITVIAGLADGRLNVNGFAEAFLGDTGEYAPEKQQYRERFVSEIRTLTGDETIDKNTVDTAFGTLTVVDKARVEAKLLDAVQPVFLKQIKLAASNLAKAKTKQDQEKAELDMLATIETLFPGTTLLAGNNDYSIDSFNGVTVNSTTDAGSILNSINAAGRDRPKLGDISLFLSTIQSEDGGNVNLFTPNGGITVGLASADIGLDKEPDKLGVIVKKQGDANLITRDDIDVNVQRVVTLGGGDITGGSTEGDVDAGRSAKTALAAPPLNVSYDSTGLPVLEVSPVLEGGGIRTVGTGNILLFAPRGIIDAGEAGIAGNNVTITATAIVGADNIDVGGTAVGVPVAATGSVAAGLTGVSNMAAAVGESVDSAANVGKEAANTLAKAAAALGILVVDILGFGE